jgi:hypothetical protein
LVKIPLKPVIKRAVLAAFPDLALRAFSIRSRRMIEGQCKRLGLDKLARQVSDGTGGKVASGPFEGMLLNYEALPVHGAPKFLGTYEHELHGVIERAIKLAPRHILNVGCAEGFYAVGLAIRLRDAQVFAADADPKALRAAIHNAALNGVCVHPAGVVKPGRFSRYLLTPGSLLIMDCEGAEFTLLNLDTDPVLAHTHIIVEVHPEFGDATELASRFIKTHDVIRIEPCPPSSPPHVSDVDLSLASDERHGLKSWLYLEAR